MPAAPLPVFFVNPQPLIASPAFPMTKLLTILTLSVTVASFAYGQMGRITPGLYGINVERDTTCTQFNQGNYALLNYCKALKIEHIRVGIPNIIDPANQAWQDLCWDILCNAVANYNAQNGTSIKLTFLFNTCVWGSTNQSVYLGRLRDRVRGHKGKVACYELGNEFDAQIIQQGRTVAQYLDWLEDVSAVIRAEDSAAKLLMASILGETKGGVAYGYFHDLLAAGCGNYVDYYTLHTYPLKAYSNPRNNDSVTLAGVVNGWVNSTGAPKRPIIITEFGYALNGPNMQYGATESLQRAWNAQRYIRTWTKDVQETYPFTRQDLFVLKDYPKSGGVEPPGYGLYRMDDTQRPQYNSVKTALDLLDRALFFKDSSTANYKCYQYLKENGQKIVVAWSSSSTNQTINIPTMSSSTQRLYVSGSLADTYTSWSSPITFNWEHQFLKTANASLWMEGENATTSWTKTTQGHTDCYAGKHLKIQTTETTDRWMYFPFSLPSGGTYAVYVAASLPNYTWTSPYWFAFRPGSSWDGGALTSSTTLSASAVTGMKYGTGNAIAWTHLGNFTFGSAGPALLTMRVNQKRSADNSYVFYNDAVYIERIN